MITIFPLESYPEIYAASLLFQVPDILNNNTSLKQVYRFWKERKDQTYITESPATTLTLNESDPLPHSLGLKVDDLNQSLFIVPDNINTFSLRELLDRNDQYIYKSSYHYWNYISQFQNTLPLDKPIIFLDLNQFTTERYIPIKLIDRKEGSLYPIPVLDQRDPIPETLQITNNTQEIYDKVIKSIAAEILQNYSRDSSSLDNLTAYLKKIRLFQYHLTQPFIVELFYQGRKYYKSVQLDPDRLVKIIIDCVTPLITNINNLARLHPEYHFVVISEYNTLRQFRNSFSSPNIVVPDTLQAEFTSILQYKQNTNLSLYGQYLDQIEFKFIRDRQPEWFRISSNEVYYEGDTETRTFIASLDNNKNNFELSRYEVNLPIKINGQDYCRNGVPQAYYIQHPVEENTNTEKLQPITIQIELSVRIGSIPQLQVRDINNNSLVKIDMRNVITYNCITLERIRTKRNEDLQRIPNPERCQEIINALSEYNFSPFNFSNNLRVLEQVEQSMKTRQRVYDKLHRRVNTRRNTDLLLNIDPELEQNNHLKDAFNCDFIRAICDLIVRYALGTFNIPSFYNRQEYKNEIKYWTIIIGKTYRFLSISVIEKFFKQTFIIKGRKKEIIGGEIFYLLARLAREKRFQLEYFNIFNEPFNQNKTAYQLNDYLWGYWRILFWYSEYDYSLSELNYSSHFTTILNYLKNEELTLNYLQDAFLCLIYLLTFREKDASFCEQNSPEYDLAQKVIQRYQDEQIKLKALPDKTLVEYFREYLEGRGSGDDGLMDVS